MFVRYAIAISLLLCIFSDLNEHSILANLKTRYGRRLIYVSIYNVIASNITRVCVCVLESYERGGMIRIFSYRVIDE